MFDDSETFPLGLTDNVVTCFAKFFSVADLKVFIPTYMQFMNFFKT